MDDRLLIFCFDISRYRRSFQFAICVCGVLVFYILYGLYQERIFQIPGFKPYGLFLTLVQFIFYSLFASLEMWATKRSFQRSISMETYFLLAFLTVGTMGMSNAAVGYLNYPTQVIFKCCKLVPVMIGGMLIQGKTFHTLDFVACILMSVGLIFFILADTLVRPNFDMIGVFMMCLALSADAAIGNVQEKSMKATGASNTELVLYSYGIGIFYVCGILLVSGNLLDGFRYFFTNPLEKFGYSFVFSLSGYLGITFVLTLVRAFGALAAVTVTTCRKALSIIISFTVFSKPFTIQYVWSGLIVLVGILVNIYQKNHEKIRLDMVKCLHCVERLIFKGSKQRRTVEEV